MGMRIAIAFPRERPRPEILQAYDTLSAELVAVDSPNAYDVIIVNTQALTRVVVDLAATHPTTPILLWIHEAWGPRDPAAMRAALREVRGVVFQSKYQRDIVYREFLSDLQVQTYFIPNTVERTEANIDGEAGPDGRRIISVGALIPRKRHSDILKALEKVDTNVECYLVGETAQTPAEVLSLIGGRHGRVVLTGYVDNAVARQWIRSATVIVHASEAESQPLVLLEAMESRRAMVLADIDAYEYMHLKHDHNCIKYAVGDVTRLSAVIKNILDCRSEQQRLGTAARLTFDAHFSPELFERRVRQLLQEVLR